MQWFQEVFGHPEGPSMSANQSLWTYETQTGIMKGTKATTSFAVGMFETPTIKELWEKINSKLPQLEGKSQGLTFGNISGDVRVLLKDSANSGAVFQVASQFNCLEMVGPGVTPESGITQYVLDKTQGPACALSCPAGTFYRNYLVPIANNIAVASSLPLAKAESSLGQVAQQPETKSETESKSTHVGQGGGNGRQINLATTVEKTIMEILGSSKKSKSIAFPFWHMANGYLIPNDTKSMKELADIVGAAEREVGAGVVRRQIIDSFRVGIHWDTEVYRRSSSKDLLKVCQVFTSAVPVAYCKNTLSTDWAFIARCALVAAFEGTLVAAAVRLFDSMSSAGASTRIKVYLTAVGGGAFGNRTE